MMYWFLEYSILVGSHMVWVRSHGLNEIPAHIRLLIPITQHVANNIVEV